MYTQTEYKNYKWMDKWAHTHIHIFRHLKKTDGLIDGKTDRHKDINTKRQT